MKVELPIHTPLWRFSSEQTRYLLNSVGEFAYRHQANESHRTNEQNTNPNDPQHCPPKPPPKRWARVRHVNTIIFACGWEDTNSATLASLYDAADGSLPNQDKTLGRESEVESPDLDAILHQLGR